MAYPAFIRPETLRELDRLRRTRALLQRRDPAGQTVAWFALGVKPMQAATGWADRLLFLSVIEDNIAYLASYRPPDVARVTASL